jgi:hypothetical protein
MEPITKTKVYLAILALIFTTIGIGYSFAENEDWNFDPVTGDRIYRESSGGCDCSGLVILIYGAIGAGLVSALASIVTLMQVSRRLVG